MSYNSFPIPSKKFTNGFRTYGEDVELDVASTEKIGGIIVGDGLSIDDDGVLSTLEQLAYREIEDTHATLENTYYSNALAVINIDNNWKSLKMILSTKTVIPANGSVYLEIIGKSENVPYTLLCDNLSSTSNRPISNIGYELFRDKVSNKITVRGFATKKDAKTRYNAGSTNMYDVLSAGTGSTTASSVFINIPEDFIIDKIAIATDGTGTVSDNFASGIIYIS